MADTKIIDLWGGRIEICEGRCSISNLEEAVRGLPDSFIKIDRSTEVSDLGVYGNNCYGIAIQPRHPLALRELHLPENIMPKPYDNLEGRYVPFHYQGRNYAVKITGADNLKL